MALLMVSHPSGNISLPLFPHLEIVGKGSMSQKYDKCMKMKRHEIRLSNSNKSGSRPFNKFRRGATSDV